MQIKDSILRIFGRKMTSTSPVQARNSNSGSTTSSGRFTSNNSPRDYTCYHDPTTQTKKIAQALLIIVAGNVAVMVSLMLTLWGFARMGDLNRDNTPWIKRAFNVTTLTLTAVLSMGIGALFDEVGHRIRWPMLARRDHTPQEVDDLLQLGNLTSSVRLAFRRRDAIITWFLLSATVGRVSVGIFGLGYSLNDVPIVTIKPVLQASIWPAVVNDSSRLIDSVFLPVFDAELFRSQFVPLDTGEPVAEQNFLYSLMLAGLNQLSIPPQSINISQSSTWDVERNLRMKEMTVSIGSDNSVSYEYNLRNFSSSTTIPQASNRTIISKAKCSRFRHISTNNRIPPDYLMNVQFNFTNEQTGDVFPASDIYRGNFDLQYGLRGHDVQLNYMFQEVYDRMSLPGGSPIDWNNDMPPESVIQDVTFDTCGSRCSTIWIWASNGWEMGVNTNYVAKCETTLDKIRQDGYEVENALQMSDQRALSILAVPAYTYSGQLGGTIRGDSIFLWKTMLEHNVITSPDDVPGFNEDVRDHPIHNSTWYESELKKFRDFSHFRVYTTAEYESLRESVPVGRSTELNYKQPLYLMPPIRTYGNGSSLTPDLGIDTDSPALDIWVAGLLARMPAALVAYIDMGSSSLLDRKTIDPGGTTLTILSTVEVEWWKTWAIVGTLTFLQVLIVLAALWYCHATIIRDNSSLVLAQSLRSFSEDCYYEVSSIAKKEQVASCLGDAAMRYGTIWTQGGLPRVEIRRKEQVESKFPAGEYD